MTADFPKRRADVLPRSLSPIGIGRAEAAAFIGVSATKFDQMVKDGRMPSAKKIDGRLVWSVRALTLAFDALPDGSQGNAWDKLCGLSSRTGAAS